MRILIIGAGATGRTLAVALREMNHDIVLLDRDLDALSRVEALVDVMTVRGEGGSPLALEDAGIAKTDMVLAVTNHDEVNILACIYGRRAGVPTKVARVTNIDYLAPSRWNWQEQGLDLLVSQNEECAREVHAILRHPGAVDVVDILEGRILAVGIRLQESSPMVGKNLEELARTHDILTRTRVIALLRQENLLIPHGETRLLSGDEAYVVLQSEDVDSLLDWAFPERPRIERDIIAGGGGIGLTLAQRMEKDGRSLTLVERHGDRAELVAEKLNRSMILKGDTATQETLKEAGIGPNTSFTAMTGDDELNIVSCVLAKTMGAAWTVAQVGKPEYVPIIRHMKLLDRVVSPYTTMINVILRFVRGQNVRAATVFQSLPGEMLEFELNENSKWDGYPLRRVPLSDGAVVAIVQRENEVFIPAGDFVLKAGDRLALFTDARNVNRVTSILKK